MNFFFFLVLCLIRNFYLGPDVEESFATVGPTEAEAYGLVGNEPSPYRLQLHCQACEVSCYRAIQTTPAPHSTLFLLPTITHILEWFECYMNHEKWNFFKTRVSCSGYFSRRSSRVQKAEA